MTDLEAIFDSLVIEFRRILLEGETTAAIFLGADGKTSPPMVPPDGLHPTDALNIMALAIRSRGAYPEWAAVCSDSYGQSDPPKKDAKRLQRGTLEARFLGGDPSVHECILVSMMARDGRHLMAQQKYTRRHLPALNRETLDFGEVERWDAVPDGEVSGAIPDALRAVLGIEA